MNVYVIILPNKLMKLKMNLLYEHEQKNEFKFFQL